MSRATPGKGKRPASDAFKRAGLTSERRELYTGPFIYVELADNEFYSERQGNKEVFKCYSNTRFKVSKIDYDDRREICDLVIVDRNGVVRFIERLHPGAQSRTERATERRTVPGWTNYQPRTGKARHRPRITARRPVLCVLYVADLSVPPNSNIP